MKRNTVFIFAALLLGCVWFAGCSNKDANNIDPKLEQSPERLIIQGTITNAESQALEGIRVDVYGVRDEKEEDILSYNYALTDSEGHYTICRYLGRTLPREVTVVASDPLKKYQQQMIAVPSAYYLDNSTDSARDLIDIHVDFVLTLLE